MNGIKEAIANNAITGLDPEMQFHLTVDVSQIANGGVLFQLYGTFAGTETTAKHEDQE